jgi:hypothetical protein
MNLSKKKNIPIAQGSILAGVIGGNMSNEVKIINRTYGVLTVQFIDKFGRVFESRNFDYNDAQDMYRNIDSWTRSSAGYLHREGH